MNLIIDIGNTVAKVAVFDLDGSIKDIVYCSNQSLDCIAALCSTYSVDQGIVATVIDLNQKVVDMLDSLPIDLIWLGSSTPLPITIAYKTPETLGYDRVAAVVEANGRFPGEDILVIDAGTALTYDFIDKKGSYYGGNISPGVKMRLKALHEFTNRLPLVEPEGEIVPLGQTTEEAIRSGVLRGVELEIRGYIEELRTKHPSVLVFLTGGNDFSFDSKLKNSIFADRFLVIKGLNRILNYNKWYESTK